MDDKYIFSVNLSPWTADQYRCGVVYFGPFLKRPIEIQIDITVSGEEAIHLEQLLIEDRYMYCTICSYGHFDIGHTNGGVKWIRK